MMFEDIPSSIHRLGPALCGVAIALASCDRMPPEAPPTALRVSPAGTEEPAQCVRDDDCVLLPSELTCCVECPPAPPFEAAPGWVLDGMLIESETVCAEATRLCPGVRCDPVPAGCTARAACVDQRCIAVLVGCSLPTS